MTAALLSQADTGLIMGSILSCIIGQFSSNSLLTVSACAVGEIPSLLPSKLDELFLSGDSSESWRAKTSS